MNPEGEFKGSDCQIPTNIQSLQMLLQGGLLCNDALLEEREGKWIIKGDPYRRGPRCGRSQRQACTQPEMRLENPRVEEIPFSSERKRMTTIHQMDDGKRMAFMKGAPEIVLAEMLSYPGRRRNQGAEAKRQRLRS